MIFFHLLRMSLENLVSRFRRTLFLVIGVAVGTGTLAFLLGLYQGMDTLVRTNLDEHRQILDKKAVLADKQDVLIQTLPVNQITLRPGPDENNETENITQQQLEEIAALEGVHRVDPVALLFPVIIGVRANFRIPGVPEKDAQREFKIPTTVYGMNPRFIPREDLLPGRSFLYRPDRADEPVPTVLPVSLLNFLNTIKSPEMVERFAEVTYTQLKLAMERNERVNRNVRNALSVMTGLGVGGITDEVIKNVIGNALTEFLGNVNERNLPQSFNINLYPGVDTDTMAIPLKVVGYSNKIPGTGLSVPIDYLERWNRIFHEETSGVLTRMFAGDPEMTFSELHVQTKGFEATVRLHDELKGMGFKVESAIDAALRLEAELKSLSAEAQRLQHEAQRVQDLSKALSQGTVVFSFLLFLLAGTVIVNGLTLSVLEQQKRIGILRAVGARRTDIITIFLFEAAVIGAAGAAVGLSLAHFGLWVAGPQLSAGLSSAGTAAEDLFRLSPQLYGAIFALGVVFSFVAGIIPAIKAAWIRPIEVLKH